MTQATHHLAQINIARIRFPLDDARMQGFVSRLDEINALAEGQPGFVWRLKGEGNDATSLRVYEDESIIVNMSVWNSADALREYVYRGDHAAVMKSRREWFERFDGMYYALWWIEAGHVPTVHEAKSRLDYLRAHGESEFAFSYRRFFPPPAAEQGWRAPGAASCPAWSV